MDNVQELREIVNPVFNTAKSCDSFSALWDSEDSPIKRTTSGFLRSWQRR